MEEDSIKKQHRVTDRRPGLEPRTFFVLIRDECSDHSATDAGTSLSSSRPHVARYSPISRCFYYARVTLPKKQNF